MDLIDSIPDVSKHLGRADVERIIATDFPRTQPTSHEFSAAARPILTDLSGVLQVHLSQP